MPFSSATQLKQYNHFTYPQDIEIHILLEVCIFSHLRQ